MAKPDARTFGSWGGRELMAEQAVRSISGQPVINSIFGSAGDAGTESSSTGTSIFDPVLCELVYRWFCPPGGLVLDPFAGGSVRGIVAAKLGRRYVGIDLRAEQVAANREQWEQMRHYQTDDEMVEVKISAKMARLRFHGCEPDYIKNVCHASCCDSKTSKTGTMITIHPSEQASIEHLGGVVEGGLLQPRKGERKCPFKTTDHLCGLHIGPNKPFGCIASPFTLNRHNTLIVRNRYKLLKCYEDGPRLPAYVAFRSSLNMIFGMDEAARICAHLDEGGGDIVANIMPEIHAKLVENDGIKHGIAGGSDPIWLEGDSRDLEQLYRDASADLIFSCPPYADLEVYSDDPRDLSTLDYETFRADYGSIIGKACAALKPDRFACFVVGDVRDKRGFYHGFPWHTVEAFQAAGLKLYNEAVLVTAVGSLPVRVGKQFESARKLGKTHQNVLIFCKGSPKAASEALGECEFGSIQTEEFIQ